MSAVVEQFFALTPERILDAVEFGGRRATGRALALNSLENRVYEIELEDESRIVAKFYRPGRWSKAAILDEHAFLAELQAAEIPVVPPLVRDDGATLGELAVEGGVIYFAAFAKARGRAPEELDDESLRQLGRLVARLHTVGAAHRAPARPRLDPTTYGDASLRILLGDTPADPDAQPTGFLPPELRTRFAVAGRAIVDACARAWPAQDARIHGDCHLGNLLAGSGGFFFLDFDDFCHGPAVQDLWLLAPGRDDDADRARSLLADGYQQMRDFDRGSLRLVEPLRALRILRYAAWIAQRWRDPAFKRAFPDWDEPTSWQRELGELEAQRARVEAALG
ncbi:MAG TPA: serine/threonine protein kinase [Polyangia bacterium]|nr:serine/threonine protein kinase [Polyangia bacterium]